MPGCIRVAAYASLDANITPMQPAHDCCSACALQCNCGRTDCRITTSETETEVAMKVRGVSLDDKQLLHVALLELKGSISSNTIMAFGDCHGFSSQLVGESIENCDKLFTLDDVLKFVPVFSAKHAMMIYEVLNDVFGDCEDISCGDEHTRELFLFRLAPMTWSTYLGLSMTLKVNHVTWTYCKIYSRFNILFLMFNPFSSRSD